MSSAEHNLISSKPYTGTEQIIIANGQNLSIPGSGSITFSTLQNQLLLCPLFSLFLIYWLIYFWLIN